MSKKNFKLAIVIATAAIVALGAVRRVFADPINVALVTVGDPGNVADGNGLGGVSYSFQMGKYDVTTSQYAAMLNAVGASDPFGLYNTSMGTSFSTQGITRSGSAGSYTYTVFGNPNMPMFDTSWGDSARFVNWLQNGQPKGSENANTTENGTYALNGAVTNAALLAATRSTTANWVLPSADEWYKAAYYSGGGTSAGYWQYPTQSNPPPSNVLSAAGTNNANYFSSYPLPAGAYTAPSTYLTPVGSFADSPGTYGTYDMGGNLWQWNDTAENGTFSQLGGSYDGSAGAIAAQVAPYSNMFPSSIGESFGFRVASVAPEPGTYLLVLVAMLLFSVRRACFFQATYLIEAACYFIAGARRVEGLVFRLTKSRLIWPAASAVVLIIPSLACGDTVNIALVQVGDPGNVADPFGNGAVPYTYQMGKNDVTTTQYAAMLNAVAASDSYGLYNVSMGTSFSTQGITRSGSSGSYSYTVFGNPNMPVFSTSWGDAARFVNWLANGQSSGGENASTTEAGTYNLNGGTSNAALMAVTRNPGSQWVLPTRDEWIKAGYYVGGGTSAGYWLYPTQSNNDPTNVLSSTGTNNANFVAPFTSNLSTDPVNHLTPVGTFAASPSYYGTYDQGGDLWQWNETPDNTSIRGLRGGAYVGGFANLAYASEGDDFPSNGFSSYGFRVAAEITPEPDSRSLFCAALLFLLTIKSHLFQRSSLR